MAVKKGKPMKPNAGSASKKPRKRTARPPLDPAGLKKENACLARELAALKNASKAQSRRLAALEKEMRTRAKREELLMAALGLHTHPRRGDVGTIESLTASVLKTDESVLAMGKRIENMLSALKNHREYLIRLNKKVYKIDPAKKIEMQLETMRNTLSIMALSGFDINKSLFGEMKRINKMLEKEDADLSKVQKRMATVKRKFDEDMERFDFESIFRKSDHIPGYR
jgi:hypothetical protein